MRCPFLSTLSLRRAPPPPFWASRTRWISIHALLAESDAAQVLDEVESHYHISIHALLAESDHFEITITDIDFNFYPRSPCGERQLEVLYADGPTIFLSTLSLRRATVWSAKTCTMSKPFLSTLSLRRATCAAALFVRRSPYFYPRSPCGERLQPYRGRPAQPCISIHALLAESDGPQVVADRVSKIFLSTLSLRRATTARSLFSILFPNFYPRSPCGERLRREMSLMRP